MKRSWLPLAPFAVLLVILPFPGTVALRLLALAVGLVVCAWVWHREGFPQVPAGTALVLWLAFALLSLATAVDPAYSLGEIKNEIGYAMAVYLGFLTLTRARADARFFVAALILGNLALSVFALREHFASITAVWEEGGLAGGSGSYSTYLITFLPALLWAGFVFEHKHRWSLVYGLIALQLILAVLTAQRTFWLVIAVQAVVALYLLHARGFLGFSAVRLRIAVAAAITLTVLALAGVTAKRFDEQALSWTQDPRLLAWSNIAGRVMEHPLMGKGFGRETMKKAYPELRPKDTPALWHPHNLPLNYGIAMGLPGIAALVLVFFSLARRFWQLSRSEDALIAMAGICGVALVAGVFVRNLTNDFFHRDLALLFWAIAGMLLGYASHASKPKP
jgi:O-antigen ligase